MTSEEYLTILRQRLARYFDFKDVDADCPIPYALLAELHSADEGYFVVPSLKTYSVKHDEFIYILNIEENGVEAAFKAAEHIKEAMRSLKPDREHMSSIFILVCLCENGVNDADLQQLLKIKYHKDYAFSLKGWSDLAVIVADLPNKQIHCNKAGRKIDQYFKIIS